MAFDANISPSWDDVPFTEEPFIKDSSLNRVFSYTGSWVIGNSIGGVGKRRQRRGY